MSETSPTIEDYLIEYACAWEGYNTSDGNPVFTKKMNEAKAKMESLLIRERVSGELDGISLAMDATTLSLKYKNTKPLQDLIDTLKESRNKMVGDIKDIPAPDSMGGD